MDKHMKLARNIIGIIGNVISVLLFLSPTLTFVEIWKKKSIEKYKADPYLATMMNNALWVFYGLPFIHPDSTLVLTTNGIGLGIQIIFICIYLFYADTRTRLKVLGWVALEVATIAVIAACTLTLVHGTDDRSQVVGIICIVFCLLMYAAPLTIVWKVIKTKSVKYMPLWISIGQFANAVIWTIYAVMPVDKNIIIPNGTGILASIGQLVLYAWYYNSTPKDDNGDDHEHEKQGPSQLQMSSSAGINQV